MSINLVVADGTVQHPALRYATDGKPEFRFTLDQQDNGFHLYLPCCASGATAERLASELEDGQHIVITSGKLCYRKRTTKAGEQSRLEILVWTADVISASAQDDSTGGGSLSLEGQAEIVEPEPNGAAPATKARRPRLPKHLKQPWVASGLVSEN